MNYRDRRRGGGGYNKPPMDDYSGRLSNVNPWQNGVQPGDQRGSLSANSILPSLSEQAKLLLANNIINTILKPEHNQISSLLSQTVGNPIGMNNYGPRNNYMDSNNFHNNNLGMGNYSGNDFQRNYPRHEPYQKTSIRNRLSAGPNQSLNEKRKFIPNRSDNSSDKGRLHKSKPFFKPTPKVIKLSKEASFKSKAQERDNKSSKRDDNEDVEKKRDWKDEKKSEKKSEGDELEESKDEEKIKEKDEAKDEKEGEEVISEDKQEKEDIDKDVEEKMEVDLGKEEKEKPDTKNDSKKDDSIKEKSKDDSNLSNYFVCHICNKTMWDERSWNNHLNGKSHKAMMAELEITYRAKIDLMRHEMKIIEQKRQLLHEKRTGQRLVASQYCVMCELRFGGNIAAHRKSDRHQKLRKFLHPNCEFCKKEFRNRLEWELHRLTLTHIRKYAEKMDKIPKSKKGKASKKGEKEHDSDNKDDDNDIEMIDNDKSNDECITLDESNEENKKKGSKLTVPQYKEDVFYGKDMISSITASYCKCCDFVFKTSDIDRHCKSKKHYNLFVKQLVADAKDLNKTNDDEDEIIELDDEGNWKRRKIIEEEYKKFEEHLMTIDSIENSQDNSQDPSALELNDSSILTNSKSEPVKEEPKEDEEEDTNLEKKEEENESGDEMKQLDELIEEVEEKIGEKEEESEEKEPEIEENKKKEEEEPVVVAPTSPMKTRETTNKARRGRKSN